MAHARPADLSKHFDPSEHQALGATTIDPHDLDINPLIIPGFPKNFTHFTTKYGVKLSFGDLIALGGDYFGLPDKPICLGLTPAKREQRFLAAFTTLDQAIPEEISTLLTMINHERAAVNQAIVDKKSIPDAISNVSLQEIEAATRATHGNYVELAEHNLDHFNRQALQAFAAGFNLATKTAIKARTRNSKADRTQQLAYAYMQLAFACHFLTDHFAAGHLRTPRAELAKQFKPLIGSLLALFQHNEDGKYGLQVRNQLNETWTAFGDGRLFEAGSKENRAQANQAVQTAIDEIYSAFLSGNAVDFEDSEVAKLIPTPTSENFDALFICDIVDGKILVRSNLNYPGPLKQADGYEALTKMKILQVIDHFADEAFEDTIKSKIATARLTVLKDEQKVSNAICSLFQKKPVAVVGEKKRSCVLI